MAIRNIEDIEKKYIFGRRQANRMDAYYDSLPETEQETFRDENWQGAFDLTPMNNDWISRGKWIQATVWEL